MNHDAPQGTYEMNQISTHKNGDGEDTRKTSDGDTIQVDRDKHEIVANLRPDGQNGPRFVFRLAHDFQSDIEAFTAAKAIRASGVLDLDNWIYDEESSWLPGSSTGFDISNIKF